MIYAAVVPHIPRAPDPRVDPRVLLGIFVGGRSSRMGRDKGALRLAGGASLIEHLEARAADAGLPVQRVGDASLPDETPEGPLGGLRALLRRAEEQGFDFAIALACDMPHVDAALLRALADAPPADLVDARSDKTPQPLCARYATSLLPTLDEYVAEGGRSLRGLYARAAHRSLQVTPALLHDWDRPEDVDLPLAPTETP